MRDKYLETRAKVEGQEMRDKDSEMCLRIRVKEQSIDITKVEE